MLNFLLLENFFSDLFTEVQIWYLLFIITLLLFLIFYLLLLLSLVQDVSLERQSKLQPKCDCFQQLDLFIKTQNGKENFADNHGKIFREFLTLYPIFCSVQVKRSVIISNKDGIYELPHKFPNDLRLRILGNQERPGKSQNFIEL